MKNLNMGIKLILGFGLVLLLTCLIGYISYMNLERTSVQADRIADTYIPVVDMTFKVESSVRGAFLEIRTYSLSRQPALYAKAEEYFTAIHRYIKNMNAFSQAHPELKDFGIFVKKFPALFENYEALTQNLKELITQESSLEKQMETFAAAADDELTKQVEVMAEAANRAAFGSIASVAVTNIDNLVQAESVRMTFLNLRRMLGTAQFNTDPELLKQVLTEMDVLHETMGSLTFSALSEESRAIADSAHENLEKYHSKMKEVENLWKAMSTSNAARAMVLEEMLKTVESVSLSAMTAAADECKLSSRTTTDAVWNNLYMVVGVVVIGFIVSLLLTRIVTVPLRKCLDFAQGVAAGNLEEQLDVHSRDETGRLSDALRSMVGTLKTKIAEATKQSQAARENETEALNAMRKAEEATSKAERAKNEGMFAAAQRLEGTVDSIGSALTQLSARIAQSGRGAATQAARVSETATAMDEMNNTVLEVARNASQASDVSAKTREKAAEGAHVVDDVVQSIQHVRTGALAMKDDMVTLDQHARAISQIMSVISDIADQTNLLALNAAIEAARAGEAGRGFAVVADEVRKLAEKTMASTTDVGNAIKAIQQSADRSMSQVDATVQGVEESTVAATRSGQALEEIVRMADLTADQVRAIATASEEQSATSEEINRSILAVNSIADETSSAMQEASSAIAELSSQADILSKLVDELKRG